jgi:tripartite-type tricarboxylate transporter receptor subunit TctC
MELSRRRLQQLAAGAALFLGLPRFALALDYPTRPVRLVVPYPAGIAPDIVGPMDIRY